MNTVYVIKLFFETLFEVIDAHVRFHNYSTIFTGKPTVFSTILSSNCGIGPTTPVKRDF